MDANHINPDTSSPSNNEALVEVKTVSAVDQLENAQLDKSEDANMKSISQEVNLTTPLEGNAKVVHQTLNNTHILDSMTSTPEKEQQPCSSSPNCGSPSPKEKEQQHCGLSPNGDSPSTPSTPTPKPAKYPCVTCRQEVLTIQPALQCDHCDHWVHTKCDGIASPLYNQYQEDTQMPYICPNCPGRAGFETERLGTGGGEDRPPSEAWEMDADNTCRQDIEVQNTNLGGTEDLNSNEVQRMNTGRKAIEDKSVDLGAAEDLESNDSSNVSGVSINGQLLSDSECADKISNKDQEIDSDDKDIEGQNMGLGRMVDLVSKEVLGIDSNNASCSNIDNQPLCDSVCVKEESDQEQEMGSGDLGGKELEDQNTDSGEYVETKSNQSEVTGPDYASGEPDSQTLDSDDIKDSESINTDFVITINKDLDVEHLMPKVENDSSFCSDSSFTLNQSLEVNSPILNNAGVDLTPNRKKIMKKKRIDWYKNKEYQDLVLSKLITILPDSKSTKKKRTFPELEKCVCNLGNSQGHFHCSTCKHIGSTKHNLLRHEAQIHSFLYPPGDYALKCQLCGHLELQIGDYSRHMLTHTRSENEVARTFANSEMDRAVALGIRDERLDIPVSKIALVQGEGLKIRFKTKGQKDSPKINNVGYQKEISVTAECDSTYSCDICDRVLASSASLKTHKMNEHGEIRGDITIYKCQQCAFQCKSKNDLSKHLKSQSHLSIVGKSPKTSSSVDKKVIKRKLVTSQRSQVKSSSVQLASKKNRDVHIDILSNGSGSFLCSICDQTISEFNMIKPHLHKTHDLDSSQFLSCSCRVCDYSGVELWANMRRHLVSAKHFAASTQYLAEDPSRSYLTMSYENVTPSENKKSMASGILSDVSETGASDLETVKHPAASTQSIAQNPSKSDLTHPSEDAKSVESHVLSDVSETGTSDVIHIGFAHSGNDGALICSICGEVLSNFGVLGEHLSADHDLEMSCLLSYNCKACGFESPYFTYFEIHLSTHEHISALTEHLEKNLSKEYLTVSYKCKDDESKHNSEELACMHCNEKTFACNITLVNHMWRTHDIQPPDNYRVFECKPCDFKTLYKHRYASHCQSKSHANYIEENLSKTRPNEEISELKKKATTASLGSNSEANMDTSPSTNDAEDNRTCTYCSNKSFTTEKGFFNHMFTKHGVQPPDGYTVYECIPCRYKTVLKGDMKKHCQNPTHIEKVTLHNLKETHDPETPNSNEKGLSVQKTPENNIQSATENSGNRKLSQTPNLSKSTKSNTKNKANTIDTPKNNTHAATENSGNRKLSQTPNLNKSTKGNAKNKANTIETPKNNMHAATENSGNRKLSQTPNLNKSTKGNANNKVNTIESLHIECVSNTYMCPLCDNKSKQLLGMKSHLLTKHKVDGACVFRCIFCDYKTIFFSDLYKHCSSIAHKKAMQILNKEDCDPLEYIGLPDEQYMPKSVSKQALLNKIREMSKTANLQTPAEDVELSKSTKQGSKKGLIDLQVGENDEVEWDSEFEDHIEPPGMGESDSDSDNQFVNDNSLIKSTESGKRKRSLSHGGPSKKQKKTLVNPVQGNYSDEGVETPDPKTRQVVEASSSVGGGILSSISMIYTEPDAGFHDSDDQDESLPLMNPVNVVKAVEQTTNKGEQSSPSTKPKYRAVAKKSTTKSAVKMVQKQILSKVNNSPLPSYSKENNSKYASPDKTKDERYLGNSFPAISSVDEEQEKTIQTPSISSTLSPSTPVAPECLTLDDFRTDELFEAVTRHGRMFHCPCGMTFTQQALYFVHRSCHDSSQPGTCALCKQHFTDWYVFHGHFFSHEKS